MAPFDLNSDEEYSEDDVVNEYEIEEHRVSEDDDDEVSNPPVFNSSMVYDPNFVLGMKFGTKAEFRKAVQSHAISTKRNLKFVKNDKIRVYVRCNESDCSWRMNALKMPKEDTFQLREYNPNHSCPPTFHVKNVKTGWLSERYAHKFQSDPNRHVKGFRLDVINDIRCHVSKDQAYRAKVKALKMLEGSPDAQYCKLWAYVEELRNSNPGSTIMLGSDNENGEIRFSRLYVCFDALKKGFLLGCRRIIGVDGCHLKGPYGGVLLTVVGTDPNNNLYPIAYAIVCKEMRETWEWFLTALKLDLEIVRPHEYTFMSDKQKGLIQAFEEAFPDSEHRFCVRHLHNNFKNAGFRGISFKNALWKAARATTEGEFADRMKEMRQLSENAANWFDDKPPNQWSRSHFSEHNKCDMLLNNVCESFNSCILDARDKPIITMSEWIREFLMKRLQENRDKAQSRWKGRLCPKIKKFLKKTRRK
ncbi:hypothetical protein DH2020_019982 [Rehmannia glutinosa]|uniref:Uncharacterized protein n=1 Tax=Rehmannia glutinosa TaxID=99300 RepID=A0ABR0WF26_REHGL